MCQGPLSQPLSLEWTKSSRPRPLRPDQSDETRTGRVGDVHPSRSFAPIAQPPTTNSHNTAPRHPTPFSPRKTTCRRPEKQRAPRLARPIPRPIEQSKPFISPFGAHLTWPTPSAAPSPPQPHLLRSAAAHAPDTHHLPTAPILISPSGASISCDATGPAWLRCRGSNSWTWSSTWFD